MRLYFQLNFAPLSDPSVQRSPTPRGEGRGSVCGGGEGEPNDVIVTTQTLARLSVVGTHAEAFCCGYDRTNITHTHTHLTGISPPCQRFSSRPRLPPATRSNYGEREERKGGRPSVRLESGR